ncbi:MAG: hypothetical protein WDW38_007451 [Sanguina aurantia]
MGGEVQLTSVGVAKSKLAEVERQIQQWEQLPDYRLVGGVQLSELAACAVQAVQLQMMHAPLQARLSSLPHTVSILQSMELPLQAVLARMEATGVMVDREKLDAVTQEVGAALKKAEAECSELAGLAVSPLGRKELREVINGQIVRQRASSDGGSSQDTSTVYESPFAGFADPRPGEPGSLNTEALKFLSTVNPLAKALIPYLELKRVHRDYCLPLQKAVDPRDGRIRAQIIPIGETGITSKACITGSPSGRLACRSPDLQSVPSKGSHSGRVRAALTATPGYTLLAADYSQIELRVIAQLSRDSALLDHFKKGDDVHCLVAMQLFKATAKEDVAHAQRAAAKNMIFGTLYSVGHRTLAAQNGLTEQTSRGFVTAFRERYPKACDYMEQLQREAVSKGYTETMFGRRCAFTFLDPRAAAMKGRAAADIDLLKCYSEWPLSDQALLKTTSQTPTQGSAADILKTAMLAVDKALADHKLDARLIITVHDELMLEVRTTDRDSGEKTGAVMQAVRAVVGEAMVAAATGVMPDVGQSVNMYEGADWKEISDKKAKTA